MDRRAARCRFVVGWLVLPWLASCGGGGDDAGDVTPPSTVTGLTVTATTPQQLQLQWSASTDDVGVTGYRVFRAAGGAASTLLKTVSATTTGDTGLTGGTRYCYSVSATDAAGNESARSAEVCATALAAVTFPGFDFALAQGDFWEYRWDYSKNSWAQGSSPSTTRGSGRFWVVLGAPRDIGGITAYAVQTYGSSGMEYAQFAPDYAYLALDDHRLLGSTDGATLTTIFDARLGKWPGGGFFEPFRADALTTAVAGTINPKIRYVAGPAIRASRSASQSQCEIIAGVRICGDDSYSITADEYHLAGVGPVAYYYYHSFESCGGGFCSGATWEHTLGMTASSFTGQPNPVGQESEPNDGPATADALPASGVFAGQVAQSTLANHGNTALTLVINGVQVTVTVEDWVTLTLAAPANVTVSLAFEGDDSADLDLFLFDANASTLLAYSVADNPATGVMTEKLTRSLAAGSYRIGIDGYATPMGARRYTLQVE